MKQDIEALLFSTDAPLTAQRLKGLLGDEVERVDGWLRDQESFFFQLIQLQSQFGVGSYLGF